MMQLTTALLVLVLSTAAIAQLNTDSNILLRSFTRTSEQLDIETYDNEAGLGIIVSSTAQSLLVNSSTGEVLVHYMKPFYKDRNGEELDQLLVFNGQPFLDHRRDNKATSYSITQEEADELTQAADQQSDFDNVIERIIQNSVNKDEFHKEALHSAITELINDPHVPLITSTAIHMGVKENIIGSKYPPVMPFYNIARLLPTLKEKALTAKTQGNSLCTADPVTCCDRKFSCYTSCPPCPQHGCAGMCGKGCSCWWIVCLDCCFNRGCCIHDYCCAQQGFLSVGCINVIGLTCKNFVCPK